MSETKSPDKTAWQRWAEHLMALCLAVMAGSVFVNVVLRYGFGSGFVVTEELSRLLFVWLVFIGATAAYPAGQHMAFSALVQRIHHPLAQKVSRVFILLAIMACCAALAWGAWQQVVVGMGSRSVVMAYPAALLPLPAFLCAVAIGVMATIELIQRKPLDLGHGAEVE